MLTCTLASRSRRARPASSYLVTPDDEAVRAGEPGHLGMGDFASPAKGTQHTWLPPGLRHRRARRQGTVAGSSRPTARPDPTAPTGRPTARPVTARALTARPRSTRRRCGTPDPHGGRQGTPPPG